MNGYEPTDETNDEPYSLDTFEEHSGVCIVCTGVVIGKICIRCGADQEDFL